VGGLGVGLPPTPPHPQSPIPNPQSPIPIIKYNYKNMSNYKKIKITTIIIIKSSKNI
jgi:hypothetical protein